MKAAAVKTVLGSNVYTVPVGVEGDYSLGMRASEVPWGQWP